MGGNPVSNSVRPGVSIIVPCYNAERWVDRAVRSALSQDYPHKEVIVVDDGSTDGSLSVIRSFGDRIRWEGGPNRGACAARNRGLDLASLDYVIFLDADDYMEGNLVGGLVSAASSNAAALAFATLVRESPEGIRAPPLSYPSDSTATELLLGWLKGECIGNGATIWRREFLISVGGWNEGVMQGQDVELVIRALLTGPSIAFASEGALIYYDHGSENRISRRVSEPILRNRLWFMEALAQSAGQQAEELRGAFANELYNLAKRAATLRYHEVSDEALSVARRLGLRGHPGSLAWRLACRILGFDIAAPSTAMMRRLQRSLQGQHS